LQTLRRRNTDGRDLQKSKNARRRLPAGAISDSGFSENITDCCLSPRRTRKFFAVTHIVCGSRPRRSDEAEHGIASKSHASTSLPGAIGRTADRLFCDPGKLALIAQRIDA
jgi:hypothetical protein